MTRVTKRGRDSLRHFDNLWFCYFDNMIHGWNLTHTFSTKLDKLSSYPGRKGTFGNYTGTQVLKHRQLICWLLNFESRFAFQTFQPFVLVYRRGNFVGMYIRNIKGRIWRTKLLFVVSSLYTWSWIYAGWWVFIYTYYHIGIVFSGVHSFFSF